MNAANNTTNMGNAAAPEGAKDVPTDNNADGAAENEPTSEIDTEAAVQTATTAAANAQGSQPASSSERKQAAASASPQAAQATVNADNEMSIMEIVDTALQEDNNNAYCDTEDAPNRKRKSAVLETAQESSQQQQRPTTTTTTENAAVDATTTTAEARLEPTDCISPAQHTTPQRNDATTADGKQKGSAGPCCQFHIMEQHGGKGVWASRIVDSPADTSAPHVCPLCRVRDQVRMYIPVHASMKRITNTDGA